MRALVAMLTALAAAFAVAGCGSPGAAGSSTTATATATPTATTPPVRRYRTALDHAVAQAFRGAYVTLPTAPTESQIPPQSSLLLADPGVACAVRGRAAYRCTVTYQPRSVAAPLHAVYLLRRRAAGCFTATAGAFAATSPLRRIHNC